MPTSTTSPSALAWKQLTDHLQQWFYRPDMEALAASLSAACAHYAVDSDPVWLFIVGPSGSGKTSVIITALSVLPRAQIMGDLSTHTFISHIQGRQREVGILQQTKDGLLLFKDFTTILSKREDDRNIIAGQLREIHDGEYVRRSGADATPWQGKITVIAAATPALERAWGIKRELGERFVTVRWARAGGVSIARFAARQRGHEKDIKARTRELTATFCENRVTSLEDLPDQLFERCATLSEVVARLRGTVVRDSYGARPIIDVPAVEEPGRLNKALTAIASANAGLWQRKPGLADLRIAERVGWDSIPAARAAIVKTLPPFPTPINQATVAELTKLPRGTVAWNAEEMEALGIVTRITDSVGDAQLTLTQEFGSLLSSASPP